MMRVALYHFHRVNCALTALDPQKTIYRIYTYYCTNRIQQKTIYFQCFTWLFKPKFRYAVFPTLVLYINPLSPYPNDCKINKTVYIYIYVCIHYNVMYARSLQIFPLHVVSGVSVHMVRWLYHHTIHHLTVCSLCGTGRDTAYYADYNWCKFPLIFRYIVW